MTAGRTPRAGERWLCGPGDFRVVFAVDSDHVAFECDPGGYRHILTVDEFVHDYTPPDPTVVHAIGLRADNGWIRWGNMAALDTHRLELLSDGTLRVVTL